MKETEFRRENAELSSETSKLRVSLINIQEEFKKIDNSLKDNINLTDYKLNKLDENMKNTKNELKQTNKNVMILYLVNIYLLIMVFILICKVL